MHVHYYLNKARHTITREITEGEGFDARLTDRHADMSVTTYTRVCHLIRMIEANTFLSGEATIALKQDVLSTYYGAHEA